MLQKKRQSSPPTVEPLDRRLLLSTMAAATAHAHHEVMLKGQISTQGPGQFHITPLPGGAESARPLSALVHGTGDLGLGTPVSVSASLNVKKPLKTLVLTTDQGNITIHTNINLNGFSTQRYTIVGGTGAYDHATGSGKIQEDFDSEENPGSDVPYLDIELAFNRQINYAQSD